MTAYIVGSVTISALSAATSADFVSLPSDGGQSRITSSYGVSRRGSRCSSSSAREKFASRSLSASGSLSSSSSSVPTRTSTSSLHTLGAIARSSVARVGSSSTSARVASV